MAETEFEGEHATEGSSDMSIVPKYMKGRLSLTEELEETLDDVPFERWVA